MGPFPNAHDGVSNITPKEECQELDELHTTARLEMPLAWWFDAATAHYSEKTYLFVRFFMCSQNTTMAPFSLMSMVCGHV